MEEDIKFIKQNIKIKLFSGINRELSRHGITLNNEILEEIIDDAVN